MTDVKDILSHYKTPWAVNLRLLSALLNVFPPVVLSWIFFFLRIKGYRGVACGCPIALFLKKLAPKRFKFDVMMNDTLIKYKDKPTGRTMSLWLSHGKNLKSYVLQFDDGKFPRNLIGGALDPSSPVAVYCCHDS